MTKDKLKGLIALGSLVGIVGFILLFYSVHFGISVAENWLISNNSIDTSSYLIIIEGNINNFSSAGSILLAIGLITIIYAYYTMLKIQK
ncbi:MAG: hypothetical protein WAM95_22235 [Bacillus sp. (in: firmicutes)]